jgi:hypothetical protein
VVSVAFNGMCCLTVGYNVELCYGIISGSFLQRNCEQCCGLVVNNEVGLYI